MNNKLFFIFITIIVLLFIIKYCEDKYNILSNLFKPDKIQPSVILKKQITRDNVEFDSIRAPINREKEVFHIGPNKFSYNDAVRACKILGYELATYNQVYDAWKKGAEWCSYGWSQGQMALFPMQSDINKCGKYGVNGGYFNNAELKFGINCWGYKKSPDPKDIIYDNTVQEEDITKEIDILPFNDKNWSKYSTRQSRYIKYDKIDNILNNQTMLDEITDKHDIDEQHKIRQTPERPERPERPEILKAALTQLTASNNYHKFNNQPEKTDIENINKLNKNNSTTHENSAIQHNIDKSNSNLHKLNKNNGTTNENNAIQHNIDKSNSNLHKLNKNNGTTHEKSETTENTVIQHTESLNSLNDVLKSSIYGETLYYPIHNTQPQQEESLHQEAKQEYYIPYITSELLHQETIDSEYTTYTNNIY